MFYPGDPIEQRKRQLIAKLAGGARGRSSAGGLKIGRPSGAGFGRGIGFGAAGGMGQRAVAVPQMLGGFGGNPEFGLGAIDATPSQGQFSYDAPVNIFGPQPTVQSQLLGPQPPVSPQLIHQILGGYGGRINPGFR